MALKGNLRDFTFTQLLNLIKLAEKTGTLTIEGANDTALVSFLDGKLAYAELSRDDSSLASLLYRADLLSIARYRSVQNRASNMGDKELGLMLINAGYLTRDDVKETLRVHFISIVSRLFTWVEGMFHFQNDILPPDDKITTRIDLENIIIEGSRRLREYEKLRDEIPNMDLALQFTDPPGKDLSQYNLSVEEWKVISYINPRNSIRQIAHATQKDDLEIRRIVYGLMQADLVELVRLEDSPLSLKATGPYANASRDEQKSLINKIIGRIRSL